MVSVHQTPQQANSALCGGMIVSAVGRLRKSKLPPRTGKKFNRNRTKMCIAFHNQSFDCCFHRKFQFRFLILSSADFTETVGPRSLLATDAPPSITLDKQVDVTNVLMVGMQELG